jgi:hypothetical protein
MTMRLGPIEVEEGRAVFSGDPGEEHYNPRHRPRQLGEANVLYRGRKQATAEASLTAAENGKLLAHGVATCMLLS